MLKSVMPTDAFFNAKDGPQVFMTDNCDEMRTSLKTIWPKSKLLLCVFNILQQVWRWLFEKEHGISKDHRVIIMKLFRNVFYAKDLEAHESAYKDLTDSPITQRYKNCLKYFEELIDIRDNWAKCFRKEQLLRGLHTNNFVEAQFLVVKDTILKRQRQYIINQLLDAIMIEFENHFKQRLLTVANGTFDGVFSSRFKGSFINGTPGIL